MPSLKEIFKVKSFWWGLIVIFILIIGVLDRNNLLEGRRIRLRIRELETQRDYYLQRIDQDSTMLERLKETDFLEKYAREKFLFKKDNETVYIVK